MKDMDASVEITDELALETDATDIVSDTLIELTDENGQPCEFQVLDVIDHEGATYLVVIDAADDDEETSEVLILRETADDEDEGLCAYDAVEDADESHVVYALFRERNADLFDFAD